MSNTAIAFVAILMIVGWAIVYAWPVNRLRR